MLIPGRCHCGNISFKLQWDPAPSEIPARACSCSFCSKHGGVWTSCPTGSLEIEIGDRSRVSQYSFGTKTAEFHVCAVCGVVPVVTSRIDGRLYAVVSVNAFENIDPGLLKTASASFDGEDEASRLARRTRNWIPDVAFVSGDANLGERAEPSRGDVHEGGCLCGKVRYRVSGPPLRTLVCHCTFCQKFTGSFANVESIFPIDAVEFSGAEMGRYDHRSDGSGKLLHLHFCRSCGTTVSVTFERGPTTRAICRGTFDDPNWVTVTRNVWVRSAQTGVALPENIECFSRASTNADQTPAPATRFEAPVMASRMQAPQTTASGPSNGPDPG